MVVKVECLSGVVAAVPTPFDHNGEPDCRRFVDLCRRLLASGCDGLNICGTTGEATSMSVGQRKAVMSAAAAILPLDRLMVGTGAASVADAVELTRFAGHLGFAGALVLPPFYYKPVTPAGIVEFFDVVLERTADSGIATYLYNFPALTGLAFTPDIVGALRRRGSRVRGLKDSSGDLAYSRGLATELTGFAVYPSDEATLLEARAGTFAGCISGTVNINAPLCAAAFRDGDGSALDRASRIRAICAGTALIPRVKGILAAMLRDDCFARVLPPLSPVGPRDAERLLESVEAVMPLPDLLREER